MTTTPGPRLSPTAFKPRLSIRPIDAYYVGRVEESALQHLMGASGPSRVAVDAGSGWGEKTEALRQMGFEAYGVEHDPARVAAAEKKYPQCTFAQGSIECLPFETASVDALFSSSVLQYVDLDAALSEYARVLRPGGRLVLIENLRNNPVAMAARLGYATGLLRYGRYMTPRQHVTPALLQALGAHGLHPNESRFFNLLTPARLAVQGLADRLRIPRLRVLAPSHVFLNDLDDRLLRWIPATKHLCWTVYVSATRARECTLTGAEAQHVATARSAP